MVQLPKSFEQVGRVELIKEIACKVCGVERRLLLVGRQRHRVVARRIIISVMRGVLKMLLKEIGDDLGLDHTTVIHNLQQVRNALETREMYFIERYYESMRKFREAGGMEEEIKDDGLIRITVTVPHESDPHTLIRAMIKLGATVEVVG